MPSSVAEWEAIVDATGGLAPHQSLGGDARFASDTIVWTGNRSQGPAQQAQGAMLTYSFPADGVTWGLAVFSPTGPNVLNAELTNIFGAGAIDLGREYFRQALAGWERRAGVQYRELPDDGLAMEQSVAPTSVRGDIRFGSVDLPGSMFAAYNAAPNMGGSVGVGGGDMLINGTQFSSGVLADSTQSFVRLRNLVAHEHGHGLGLLHVVPCTNEKLMEPTVTSLLDGVQTDDARGAMRHYGDRFAGNHTAVDAHDLGELASPSPRSIAERDLSTNGAGAVNGTGEDWFRFSITSAQDVIIDVLPTGGVYNAEQQIFGCFGPGGDPVRDAQGAGDLTLELWDATGSVMLDSSNMGAAGAAEAIVIPALAAGVYTIRVVDVGPNDAQDQFVQMYDLEVRVAGAPLDPTAIAGIDKRVRAGTTAYFIADLHSATNEPGAVMLEYDWDLDGDGVFETLNDPRPTFVYPSNGVFDVELRVTDSNLCSSKDSIKVTVFGATTTVMSVSPSAGDQGLLVPVTITGTNLKNVISASQVTVLGGGVQVTGTPASNSLGTQLTGLSFVIAPDAALGARDVRIQNQDGIGVGASMFTIREPLLERIDLNDDGLINGADLAILLANWGPCPPAPTPCPADFNESGNITGEDLSFILANWD